MVRLLSRSGLEAHWVQSGASALAWIEKNRVDLVLLDADITGPDALDVLRSLRMRCDPVRLPVVLIAGRSGGCDSGEALDCGANDYITRPVDFAIAQARIRTLLSRKRAEEALRKSEQRYALAAQAANDGLWDWDFITNKIYYSPRWKSMLGWKEDEIGDTVDEWFRRIHPDDAPRVRSDIAAHLKELTPHYEGEYRIKHKDGNYLWMLGRGIAVRGERGKAYRMAGSQTDITRGKVVDVLTGLPNRVLFMDRLARSFERAKRNSQKPFALIFLDLDSFKLINDSLGHLIGDQVLGMIAGRIEATVRTCDTVARYGRNHTIARLGGDEFTILLEDISGSYDATRVAERIAAGLSEPFVVNNQKLYPSASIGIAVYHPQYNTPEEILRDADTAMYNAKSLGKGRYEVFDSEMRATAVARLQLEKELRRALDRQEFEVFYQPAVALETGKILGFEALVRWNHASQGIVPPSVFVPVAEETGLIVPLGRWVLETACQQARIWQTRFASTNPLSISINISKRHFLQSDLVQHCRMVLDETQLSHSSLVLEVTEGMMMPDPEAAIRRMVQLKDLGIRIALDDFGTGYSSLRYLHMFPLDSLKIDRSFVDRMMETNDEIVRTIITLGINLGLEVIAEGVETVEQAEKLRQLGCRCAQGYFYSVPVRAAAATDLLMEKHFIPTAEPGIPLDGYSMVSD